LGELGEFLENASHKHGPTRRQLPSHRMNRLVDRGAAKKAHCYATSSLSKGYISGIFKLDLRQKFVKWKPDGEKFEK
jgi:hypothetical protein